MVVDDDPGTTSSLRVILKNKGHYVGTAATGEEAIELAREKKHDVIFLDMKLPTINGLQTYLAIKEINPGIIAVMITAYRDEMSGMIQNAKQESAYSILYKPFNMESLLKIIEEIGRLKRDSQFRSDGI